jgi:TonB family protein
LTDKTAEADLQAKEALKLDARDPQAHFVVGVVHLREGRDAEARTEAEYVIRQTPNVPAPYLLKCQAIIATEASIASRASKLTRVPQSRELTDEEREGRKQRLRQRAASFQTAADALRKYLQLAPPDSDTPVWQEQLEALHLFGTMSTEHAAGDYSGVFAGVDLTTKAVVRTKPEAPYPRAALNSDITGTVILLAVFSANGTVEHILVLRSLPLGLTANAVAAARKIKFDPATKDGRQVSQLMQLEYTFNIIN